MFEIPGDLAGRRRALPNAVKFKSDEDIEVGDSEVQCAQLKL